MTEPDWDTIFAAALLAERSMEVLQRIHAWQRHAVVSGRVGASCN